MLPLLLLSSLAQAQPGQVLLRADLVRSPRGSNLILRFAKPIDRRAIPVVPAGRRLILHLPGRVAEALEGTRRPMGVVRRLVPGKRRITVYLSRLARPFADRAVVRGKGKVWRLKMTDPTVERDLADLLLGTPKARPQKQFDAFEEANKLAAERSEEKSADESAQAAQAVAAAVVADSAPAPTPATEAGTPAPEVAPEAPVPPPESSLGSWVRGAAGVGLVALGLFGWWGWRRRDRTMEEAFGLKVVSRARLDHKSSVAVLEAGGAVLIVGLSDQGPRLLARLDGDAAGVPDDGIDEAERLRSLVGRNPAGRLEEWMGLAQNSRPEPAPAAAAAVDDEREDLKRRLAEIRRKVG